VLAVLQDQENQGNDEPMSAIRAKLFPTCGVHQPETMVGTRSRGFGGTM
jgi:hypothetical protein